MPAEAWAVLYPRYVNKNATLREGRRIGQEFCVANPSLVEIEEALKEAFPTIEYKAEPDARYPRGAVDDFDLGRLRLNLKPESGEPLGELRKLGIFKALAPFIADQRRKAAETEAEAIEAEPQKTASAQQQPQHHGQHKRQKKSRR